MYIFFSEKQTSNSSINFALHLFVEAYVMRFTAAVLLKNQGHFEHKEHGNIFFVSLSMFYVFI